MSIHLYTMIEGMRGVQDFLENSKDLLYILVHRLVHRIVNLCVDPAFRLMRFSLDGELDFNLKMILFIKIMTWSRYLFLFYFQKVNKIRKKNPKCDSLPWKRWSVKNRIGFGDQVTYQEGTVKTVAPL